MWPFKRKPKTFFTSDLHFGHKNVITYCNRPWPDLETMHIEMVKIWNKQVKPEDTVFVLGDFSLAPKWSGIIGPQLNGIKFLISGNHDATFQNKLGQSSEKTDSMVGRYKRDGWAGIYDSMRWDLKDGTKVNMCHFPYDQSYDERYADRRLIDDGTVLLHGHLHSKYRKKGHQIDVGFDGDLKLWSEDEIIKLIKDKRDFIPTPITEYYKTRDVGKNGLSSKNNV